MTALCKADWGCGGGARKQREPWEGWCCVPGNVMAVGIKVEMVRHRWILGVF